MAWTLLVQLRASIGDVISPESTESSAGFRKLDKEHIDQLDKKMLYILRSLHLLPDCKLFK
jgi:hypothetical protein